MAILSQKLRALLNCGSNELNKEYLFIKKVQCFISHEKITIKNTYLLSSMYLLKTHTHKHAITFVCVYLCLDVYCIYPDT